MKLEYFIVENNVVDNEKNIKQNDEIRNERKNNTLLDIGTDILYITKDNKCVIVQCKNYSNNIRVEDLSGFFFIFNHKIPDLRELWDQNRITLHFDFS